MSPLHMTQHLTQHLTRLGQGEIPPPPQPWPAFGDLSSTLHWLLIATVIAIPATVLGTVLVVRRDRRRTRTGPGHADAGSSAPNGAEPMTKGVSS